VPEAVTDLGDAPDSTNSLGTAMEAYAGVTANYPTVYGAGSPPYGPRHANNVALFWLGDTVTAEWDADDGPDADGTNNINPGKGSNTDGGDDSYAHAANLRICETDYVHVTVSAASTLTTPMTVYVNIWLDWNRDGDWLDTFNCDFAQPREWAVVNAQVRLEGPRTTANLGILAYNLYPTRPMWMRITVSESAAASAGGAGPAGGYAYGETEDYYLAYLTPTPTASPTMVTPSPTATRTQTPVPPDLAAENLEITQGIQNWWNEVPLVASRTTYIRAWVSSNQPGVRASARLRAFRGGTEIGSAVYPQNPGGLVRVPCGDAIRGALDDAFLFETRPEWRSGTVTFQVDLNWDHAVTETSYGNNTRTQTVTFLPGNSPVLLLVPTLISQYRPFPSAETYYYSIGERAIRQILYGLDRYHPIWESRRYVWLYEGGPVQPWIQPSWAPLPGWALMMNLGVFYAFRADDYPGQHYVAMVHPQVGTGSAAGQATVPGHILWARMDPPAPLGYVWWYNAGGHTLAHELGHNLGLLHVNCSGSESGGGEVDGGYPWPYPNCSIAPTDELGYYGLDVTHALIGLSQVAVINNKPLSALDQQTGFPLMGYQAPTWTSPWEWCKLLRAYGIPCGLDAGPWTSSAELQRESVIANPSASADTQEVAALRSATVHILATGVVTTSVQSGQLLSVMRMSDALPQTLSKQVDRIGYRLGLGKVGLEAVTYALAQLDGAGHVLATNPIYLDEIDGSTDMRLFTELVPLANGATRLQLRANSVVLDEQAASAHPPEVTLTSPNAGEVLSAGSIIRWSASDADGDALSFTLLYSRDHGVTWNPFKMDATGSSYTLESPLRQAEGARMRIIASDGFYTDQDDSDGEFSIPSNEPMAIIGGPAEGARIRPGTLVTLEGWGYDLDDGPLADEALSWSSSRDGSLGSGFELQVGSLSEGEHTITLRVTDSDKQVGTAVIHIVIGPTDVVMLPIIRRR
jgi:hypothetical protein